MEQSLPEKIDIFTHILPEKYGEALKKVARESVHFELQASIPAISSLKARIEMMDKYKGLSQVLTLAQPPLESVVDPQTAVELSKLANDEMAELVIKYPQYFVAAVACLPMNDTDSALKEADRALGTLGLKGIQLFTPVKDKPLDNQEFMGLYELMCKYDLPIWIHPAGERSVPDFAGENQSKYDIYSRLKWPYETSVAMARLVYSGVFDKYPGIKFITHHGGAMTPFFASRLSRPPVGWQSRAPLEHFKMFYVDTALGGYVPSIQFSYSFFGDDHVLFGTDSPFGLNGGIMKNLEAINSLDIPAASKLKITKGNAVKLLHL